MVRRRPRCALLVEPFLERTAGQQRRGPRAGRAERDLPGKDLLGVVEKGGAAAHLPTLASSAMVRRASLTAPLGL